MARAATAPDKILLAGVGRESVFETLRMADYAAALDYDEILVRTPHYYRKQMRNREMLTYYQAVADRSPLPALLYSVPGCTAYDLPVEVVAELMMHPNIVGMKDSSGNVDRIAQLVHATRSVKKRSVPVTTLFAAVTARMLRSSMQAESHAGPTFVAADRLGSGMTALGGEAPPRPRLRRAPRTWDFSCCAVLPKRSIPHSKREPRVECWRWQPSPLKPARRSTPRGRRTTRRRLRISSGASCGRESRFAAKMGIPGVKYALDLNGYYGGRPRMPLLPLVAEEQRLVEELTFDIRN